MMFPSCDDTESDTRGGPHGVQSNGPIQALPILMPSIKNIAVSGDGAVYSWGDGLEFKQDGNVLHRTRENQGIWSA